MAFDLADLGEAGAALATNGVRLGRAFAAGAKPPPRMTPAEWAARYRRFPDDAPFPGRWRHETSPNLVEIMDALAPHDPCEEVAVIKCAQSGGSAAAENWVGFISDVAPGPLLWVQATQQAAWEWAAEKFWPMVDATPRLNEGRGGTIRAQTSDGEGSTKKRIRFARSNGYVLLAGANSAPSLRQRTVRYAVEDDLDQFPDDLDGQGSPEVMVDQRLKVYRRQGLSKRFKISTPTIAGASKIGAAYATSDRRRFYLVCPTCGDRFDPVWSDVRWADGRPETAHLVAPCCGGVMEHWQKPAAMKADGWASVEIEGERAPRTMDEATFQAWRARMPRSVRRGFHIGGLVSAFQTWSDMAASFLAAQGDLNKLRAWTNLDLGEVFEVGGGAPDHERLKGLREQDWGRDRLPVGPVVVTLGVDVQGDGVFWELVGWGPNAESWSLDAGFIPGQTEVKGAGAWLQLDTLARRPLTYPGGRTFGVDQVCVDAGYHTEAAEAFCRAWPNRLPVFGRAGWTLPVLGRGENLRYEKQGRRSGQASKRAEDKAYVVGTFGVKLTWYGYLRATLEAAEAEARGEPVTWPRGRVHVSRDTPDAWFEQVTSETVVTDQPKRKNGQPAGFPKRVWRPLQGRENHWLDCRVYNTAAAEKLMLDTLTEAQWAALRAERYAPADRLQGDLLDLVAAPAAPIIAPLPAPASPPPAAPVPAAASADSWITVDEGWL